MGIVKEASAGDSTLEQDGLKMFLERDANNLLDQATIDFTETQGFVVTGMPHSSCSH